MDFIIPDVDATQGSIIGLIIGAFTYYIKKKYNYEKQKLEVLLSKSNDEQTIKWSNHVQSLDLIVSTILNVLAKRNITKDRLDIDERETAEQLTNYIENQKVLHVPKTRLETNKIKNKIIKKFYGDNENE